MEGSARHKKAIRQRASKLFGVGLGYKATAYLLAVHLLSARHSTEFRKPWGKVYFALVYGFGGKEVVARSISTHPSMRPAARAARLAAFQEARGFRPRFRTPTWANGTSTPSGDTGSGRR